MKVGFGDWMRHRVIRRQTKSPKSSQISMMLGQGKILEAIPRRPSLLKQSSNHFKIQPCSNLLVNRSHSHEGAQ